MRALRELLQLRIFQSRVAWCLLCTLVLCSLIPLVGFASLALHHVTAAFLLGTLLTFGVVCLLSLGQSRLVESLRGSEQRYRGLVEHGPGAICLHDLHGTLLFVNQAYAEPLGYNPAELVGRNLGELIAPAVREEFIDYLARCAQDQRADGLVRLLTKEGKERLWIYRSRRYEEAGTPPYVIGHGQDITEQRHLERQLRQAQKMQAIGTLAGGIAHDFNNILTAILGYTELTLEDVPAQSVAWSNLQEVLMAGQRAKGLVQQILTFSRQQDPERKSLDLHLLVKEVLKLLRVALPATIEIRQHLEATVGQVLADPTQMHQVLMNLCTNAGYAMKDKGGILEVSIDAVQVDETLAQTNAALHLGPYVRLNVRDTGHGMTPEVLARIFEPFFTTRGVGEGTGLGLSVVHGIVANHGGSIMVESQPGEGTTFTVYLPQVRPGADDDASGSEPTPSGSGRPVLANDEVATAFVCSL
jgi:PAS domain S-box-containing protein